MKTTFRPHLLLIAAPLCALTVFSSAQVPTPKPAGAKEVEVRSAIALPQDLHASGSVSSFDANGLTVLTPTTGSMTVYLTNADTMFVDKQDRFVAPDRIIPQTPVTVHYTPVGNSVLATKVVVTTSLFSSGKLIEAGPGMLVITTNAAPNTPVRYVYNATTRYVDKHGDQVPAQALKPGASVRIFYTQAGDALVASKVEMLDDQASSTVSSETTTTTTTREIKR